MMSNYILIKILISCVIFGVIGFLLGAIDKKNKRIKQLESEKMHCTICKKEN